jgi:ABC-type Na+ transport system ATPase subunit NatA
MIEELRDLWSKLTVEEQAEFSRELNKILQEEIDREIISVLRGQTALEELIYQQKDNRDGN